MRQDFIDSYNYISAPVLHGVALNVYLYVLGASMGLLLIGACFFIYRQHTTRHIIRKILVGCLVGLTLMSLSIQTRFQFRQWHKNIKLYGRHHDGTSKAAPWGGVNKFCDFVLENLPNGKKCQCLGSTSPAYIRYLLYPRIRVVQKIDAADCVLIYKKKSPKTLLPKDFSVVKQFDKKGLIACRR